MTATNEYAQQVLTYEQTAFTAASSGDYATAVTVWSNILGDENMKAVFAQDAEALQELIWNLALAYGADNQKEKGEALVQQYGLDAAAYAQAFGGAS